MQQYTERILPGTTETSPLISVIVPVFNTERYLSNTISSLTNQTYHKIEIILIDDGSCDRSFTICRESAAADNRIRVLHLDHKGVSAARNAGLRIAKGEYIAFVDADDWVESDMLEYLIGLTVGSGADLATCEIAKEYPGGKSQVSGSHQTYPARGLAVIDEINYGGDFSPFPVNKLYKKELLKDIRFPEKVTIGEDYRFIMEVMLKNPFILRGGECKYHYVQHTESVSYQGYQGSRISYKNLMNYKDTFEYLHAFDSAFYHGALAYYVLQVMASVISMVKADCFDRMISKYAKREVRKYVRQYLLMKRVPFYLKGCAVLLSIHEKLLLIPYKLFFHRARSVR